MNIICVIGFVVGYLVMCYAMKIGIEEKPGKCMKAVCALLASVSFLGLDKSLQDSEVVLIAFSSTIAAIISMIIVKIMKSIIDKRYQ